MSGNRFQGNSGYPSKANFNPKTKKVFRLKTEKILGSLYLTKPFLERMQIKKIIDNIVPERLENGQIVTSEEISEVLVANRLHHPRPLHNIEKWAELCGIETICALNPEQLNDDRLDRFLEDLAQYFEEIITALALHVTRGVALNTAEILWDTTSVYFVGDYDFSELLRFGYGEKPDLKQIKPALKVEKESSILSRVNIFTGNQPMLSLWSRI